MGQPSGWSEGQHTRCMLQSCRTRQREFGSLDSKRENNSYHTTTIICIMQHLNGGRSSVGRAPDCDSGCRGFKSHRPPHFLAEVVELVDTLDLGSSASRRESSSLSFRTNIGV